MYLRYTEFGGAVPYRPVEDIAYSVARFILKGGSFVNYYMVKIYTTELFTVWFGLDCQKRNIYGLVFIQYHGGTNFDRTAGEFMASSYDYDAPLDEYGTNQLTQNTIKYF